MAKRDESPPFEGGAQPVPENPPEVPGRERTVLQTVALLVGALVVLAAILWMLVPILSA